MPTLLTSFPTDPTLMHEPLSTESTTKGVHIPEKFSSVQNTTLSCAVIGVAIKDAMNKAKTRVDGLRENIACLKRELCLIEST